MRRNLRCLARRILAGKKLEARSLNGFLICSGRSDRERTLRRVNVELWLRDRTAQHRRVGEDEGAPKLKETEPIPYCGEAIVEVVHCVDADNHIETEIRQR